MEMGVILHAPKEDKDVRILGHDSFEIIIKRITTMYAIYDGPYTHFKGDTTESRRP